jgi:RNA polymerase sigma factor (sigma-70 family)
VLLGRFTGVATSVVGDDLEARFESLYREHVRDVYRYALAVVRDPAAAEDLTQATFLRAWRAFRDGVSPRAPQNWFLRIAHNVLRTHFRTQSRRPREVELRPELEPSAPANGPTAAEVLEALGELPLNQREALVMRELEGRSYVEIAQILGVSRAAVEALVFRARTHLRVRRSDLRRIASIPLPASLASFSSGGASVGGLVVKAIAVVAAGVVAVGVGKEAIDAVAEDAERSVPAVMRPAPQAPVRAKRGPVAGVRGNREVPPTTHEARENREVRATKHEAPSVSIPSSGTPVIPLDDTEPEPAPAPSPPLSVPLVTLPPTPSPDEAATVPPVPDAPLPQPPGIPLESPLPPLPEPPEIPTVPLP